MNKKIKIITLGDIFENLETEDKAFKFLKYIKELQEENENKNNKIVELQQELLNKKLNVKDIEYKEKMIYKSRINIAIRTLETLKGSARWERHLYEIDELIHILQGDTDGSNK